MGWQLRQNDGCLSYELFLCQYRVAFVVTWQLTLPRDVRYREQRGVASHEAWEVHA